MRRAILAAVVAACDGGYQCLSSNSCLPPDAPDFYDAPVIVIDAVPDAYVCPATDEPNDTIATAVAVPLPVSRANLAICTVTDADVYRITTTQVATLVALTTVSSGQTIAVSILTPGGASLATGIPINAYSVSAAVGNLPVGDYYVRMTGPVAQTYGFAAYTQ
jgi:hypothetical protein